MSSFSKLDELKQRVLFLLAALFVFRLGAHIPLPGINPEQIQQLFSADKTGLSGILNVLSGGAFSKLSVFALGLMPYISAAILVQLMGFVLPSFERLKKEGKSGRKTLTKYTRIGALLLAIAQGAGISSMLHNSPGMVLSPGWAFHVTTILTLSAGTLLLMWLGEQISERGLGNGTSLIIFAGIAAGIPNSLGATLELITVGGLSPVLLGSGLIVGGLALYGVVLVEKGQRRVLVSYARSQPGATKGQGSYLPMKLNMAGVTPAIFASALVVAPSTLLTWLGPDRAVEPLRSILSSLSQGGAAFNVLFALAIIGFSFIYSKLLFNTKETADTLQKTGGFLPGIRPGEATVAVLDGILLRLSTVGALYLAVVCLAPGILAQYLQLPFGLSGTSMLISVIVTVDLMAQVQNYMTSHRYKSLLKK